MTVHKAARFVWNAWAIVFCAIWIAYVIGFLTHTMWGVSPFD